MKIILDDDVYSNNIWLCAKQTRWEGYTSTKVTLDGLIHSRWETGCLSLDLYLLLLWEQCCPETIFTVDYIKLKRGKTILSRWYWCHSVSILIECVEKKKPVQHNQYYITSPGLTDNSPNHVAVTVPLWNITVWNFSIMITLLYLTILRL